MSAETTQLLEAIGALAHQECDPRIDMPLVDRVRRLMEWASSENPARFTRSVPVRATDHDELISWALVGLIKRIAELERQLGAWGVRLDPNPDTEETQ